VALALAPGKHLNIPRRVFWLGVTFGVVAALGQGLGAVLSRVAVETNAAAGTPVDGLTAAFQRILAGIVVGVAAWLFVKLRPGVSALPPASHFPSGKFWPWIIANALSGPAIGVGCYQWALMQEKSGVV